MGALHRALVGIEQPPFDQGGDPVHCGQQLAGILPAGLGGALAAPVVDVAELAQAAVALPGVSDHRRARLNVIGDKGVLRLGGGIGQRRYPAPAHVSNINLDMPPQAFQYGCQCSFRPLWNNTR